MVTYCSTGQQAAITRLDEASMDPQYVIGDHERLRAVAVRG
jgi:hypothetical protein